jgi:hypothetical protein
LDLTKHIVAAKQSNFGLWKLNFIMHRGIPFNKPHNIRIIEIGEDHVKVRIPYKRWNLNHIKGIHACGLATAAEYSSGFMLLTKLGFKKYRIIMESMEMKYHYQAKMTAIATFKIDDAWLKEHVFDKLAEEGVAYAKCEILVHDTEGNHVCTGYTNWQIKEWSKVKTKL